MAWKIDWSRLTLDEFIALDAELQRELRLRYQREVALVFTDVVDSTSYAERWGDVAARSLLDRHVQLVNEAAAAHGGRVVDLAGDGAFWCFPDVEAAAEALEGLLDAVTASNEDLGQAHHLVLRTGIHYGPVLMDEFRLSGEAVNVAARVMGSARSGEIRLSRDAVERLESARRATCERLGVERIKGVTGPVELWLMRRAGAARVPVQVWMEQTGRRKRLPHHSPISFGRLAVHQGRPANDVVLALDDPRETRRISRWHFEVLRQGDALTLRQLSDGSTEVDGERVERGATAPLAVGTTVVVAGVLRLVFQGPEGGSEAAIETQMPVDLES